MKNALAPTWIAACIFTFTFCFGVFICALGQKAGLNLVSVGEEIPFAAFLALVAGFTAFILSLQAELEFLMQMQALKDRQISWTECRIFDTYRLADEGSRFRWAVRIWAALTTRGGS